MGCNTQTTTKRNWRQYVCISHTEKALLNILIYVEIPNKPCWSCGTLVSLIANLLMPLPEYSTRSRLIAWLLLSQLLASQRHHYDDVIMGAIASLITSLTIVYSTVYSDADQRKHQSSASLAFVWGIHRGPVSYCLSSWRPKGIITMTS